MNKNIHLDDDILEDMVEDIKNIEAEIAELTDKLSSLKKRLKRKQNICGLTDDVPEKDNILKVSGSSGNEYIVNLTRKTCTCADWQYRKAGTNETCKHLDMHL